MARSSSCCGGRRPNSRSTPRWPTSTPEFTNFFSKDPLDPALFGPGGASVPDQDLSGNATRMSPDWSLNLFPTYDIDLANGGTITLASNFAYRSKQYHTEFNDERLSQGDYVMLDANILYRGARRPPQRQSVGEEHHRRAGLCGELLGFDEPRHRRHADAAANLRRHGRLRFLGARQEPDRDSIHLSPQHAGARSFGTPINRYCPCQTSHCSARPQDSVMTLTCRAG